MNNNCLSRSTDMWLIGRRVHDRLWELTNPTQQKDHADSCSHCGGQASSLTEYLTTHDVSLFLKWDTFLNRFDELYSGSSDNFPVLVIDAEMVGKQRLQLLQAYQRKNQQLPVISYMATGYSGLAMRMDELGFSGYMTRQDADDQWIRLLDTLQRDKPYRSTGWMNLLRESGLMFAGDSSVIHPLADWIGQASEPYRNQVTGQKVGFLAD